MADTFSQIYIHVVFAVKYRKGLIAASWEQELYKYISGIIFNKGQKLLIINGAPDHLHILISMRPSCCLSDLVREIKKSSNEYVRANRFTKDKFQWQEGFGAFSCCPSSLEHVIAYIKNQKQHHAINKFQDEYQEFLKEHDIDFDPEYLFDR
jgi:REP element-mobilizing transposase RayT